MVFADRMEIISGGNFHGEYPAKVSVYAVQKDTYIIYYTEYLCCRFVRTKMHSHI